MSTERPVEPTLPQDFMKTPGELAELLEEKAEAAAAYLRSREWADDPHKFRLAESSLERLQELAQWALDRLERETQRHDHMTLEALAGKLAALEAHVPLAMEDGAAPHPQVHSYRGYYSHAAIPPGAGFPTTTAGGMLETIRRAMGLPVYGWKGGEFRLYPDTPVWIAPLGENSQLALTDVREEDGRAVLMTRQL